MAKRIKKDTWDTFGHSLGFAAKSWIQAYGHEWQMRLAEALLIGRKKVTYTHPMKGPSTLSVPKPTPWLRQQAFRFYQRQMEEEDKYNRKHPQYRGKHAVVSSAQDLFNLKVYYGNKRLYDTRSQTIIERYREELMRTTDFKERRRVKKEMERFKASSKRKAWEVIHEMDLTSRAEMDAPLLVGEALPKTPRAPDYSKVMGRLDELALKHYDLQEEELSEMAMDEAEALVEGRWLEMTMKNMIHDISKPNNPQTPMKIVEYLSTTQGPYRKDLIDMIRKHQALKNLVKNAMGKKWMQEHIESAEADVKYSTTTFKPRPTDLAMLEKMKQNPNSKIFKNKYEKTPEGKEILKNWLKIKNKK